MNNFVWNPFGVLISVTLTDKFVVIKNNKGETRKMSLAKYKDSAITTHRNAQALVGKNVDIRTSQNTASWQPSVWFSDIVEKSC